MKESIAIVGAGAVGLYYGGMLARAGNDVRFLLRSGYDEAREHGIRILSGDNEWRIHPAQICRDSAEIGVCDCVLIATKTFHNAALPSLLHPLVGAHTHILTLQNGLGNEAFLAQHFDNARILGGMCFVCLNRASPATVRHIDHGLISMAPLTTAALPACEAIAAKLRDAGIPVHVHENLSLERWKKLMWNIPFNGMTIAHGGVAVDVILNDPAHCRELLALMREIRHIAAHLGHAIPENFVEELIARTRTMGAYRPSSLVDYLNGQEIELDAIWGEPLRQARQSGFEAPYLEKLHTALTAQLSAR